MHSHPGTRIYVDGSGSRMPGLTEAERARLGAHPNPPDRAQVTPPSETVARQLA